jgi:autotransporter-associated beta strand protein
VKKKNSASAIAMALLSGTTVYAGTTNFTWTGASNGSYGTAGNWVVDQPSAGTLAPRAPSSSVGDDFVIFQGGVANRTLDLTSTRRHVRGIRFDDAAGANAFTFNVSGLTTATTGFGFGLRPDGILNNESAVQIFNVPIQFFSYGGGNPTASTTYTLNNTLSGGGLTFSGAWTSGTPGKETINMNGGSMIIDGVAGTTTTIGTTGGGIISGTGSSITKNGAGSLVLGGTVANTYTGGTIVNNGTVTANKANAFGTGHLTVNSGGSVNIGANNQTVSAVTNAGGTITGTGTITASAYHFSGGTVNAKLAGNANLRHTSGTTTIGGTSPNTFVGTISLEGGKIIAAKNAALGTGNNMTMSGNSTFDAGGFSQTFGTLDLAGQATLDFSVGDSTVIFADSSAIDWSNFTLTIVNFTVGSDILKFGADGNGLTQAQLDDIIFADFGNAHGQIDALGNLSPVPVPEPSTMVMGLFGGLGMMFMFRRFRSSK